ncbi:PRC-barrel domain containing protein [Streptomyces sp. R41]|uniref:PRC-barrel domain containing protein n=1 Tax=Streptomyces sp. R41 TaxID=3238632 RepID=A0AB39RSY8_9ACTN
MIKAADIRAWCTHDVVDPKGHKIGVVEAVYGGTTTDEPARGHRTDRAPDSHRRLVFVPLDDALPGPGYVKISYARSLVRRALSIGTDDILAAEQEEAIFQHYGMTYSAGRERRTELARR